jgi:hypothetical protein
MQNSPEFISEVVKYKGMPLLILKKRILSLVGENGLDRLEMAIPKLRIRKC